MKRALEQHVPGLEVVGTNYPPPLPKALLAKAVGSLQFLVIALTLAGHHLFPGAAPPWLKSLQDSKLQSCMAAWFVGNIVCQNLISTGAFEVRQRARAARRADATHARDRTFCPACAQVYYDGALVFSKLATGKTPDLNFIVAAVLKAHRAAQQ